MKKSIKTKKQRKEASRRATATVAPDPPPTKVAEAKERKIKAQIQALLLMEMSPSDQSPSRKSTQRKKNEEQSSTGATRKTSGAASSSDFTAETQLQPQETRAKTICRGFIKGKCTRGVSCRFSHKYSIMQLVGNHNFCKNFQESTCTEKGCKYIHATVSEEERFYETGELPRHTLPQHRGGRNPVTPPSPPSPPCDDDRSLQDLDNEEEELRQRIDRIKEKLVKVRRARSKKRRERETLERAREQVEPHYRTPPGENQKLLLDQLNEAIKAKIAANQPTSDLGEVYIEPKLKEKIYLDRLNHAIKLKFIPSKEQQAANMVDSSRFWATLMEPGSADEGPGSQACEHSSDTQSWETATLDEAAGPLQRDYDSDSDSD